MPRRTSGRGSKQGPDIWVVPRGGRFSIKEAGAGDYLTPQVTQRMAILIARLLARANGSELVIEGRDSRIRVRDSHGADSPYRRG